MTASIFATLVYSVVEQTVSMQKNFQRVLIAIFRLSI